jgi:S-adenosylmethionine decarboxylase
VYFAPSNDGKDPGGWTGMVVLNESHISLHTFPARGFLSADVYTCRNGLEVDVVRRFFEERFAVADAEVHLIRRGTRYPARNLYPERVHRSAPAATSRGST